MGFTDTLVSAKSGDSQAEEELFGRWRSLLNVHAARSLAPDCAARVDPSDVVQEALTQASRELTGFRGQNEAQWVRWLQTIVAGHAAKARQHHHAQKRDVQRDVQPTIELAKETVTAEGNLERLEEAAATADALHRIPADMRAAIIHRVFSQQSWQTSPSFSANPNRQYGFFGRED